MAFRIFPKKEDEGTGLDAITENTPHAGEDGGKPAADTAKKQGANSKPGRDVLTGIHGKEAFLEEARELSEEENCPPYLLAVVDIDGFKRINRANGHLFGDMLLCGLAGKLKRYLNEDDIIGRIGGDEFIMLMKGIESKAEAASRLEALMSVFINPFGLQNDKLEISACIGAALYPDHGKSFNEVFENMDFSLTYSKQLGRGKSTLFSRSLKRGRETVHSYVGSVIDKGKGRDFDENFTEHVLEILYNSRKAEEVIPVVLSYIGNRFELSRAYVITLSESGEHYVNTFEWTSTRTSPRINVIPRIPVKEFDYDGFYYRDYFKDENLFVCADINELKPNVREILNAQSVKSFAQFALLDGGEFAGFIGYEDCEQYRKWRHSEIQALTYVSRVLSVFFVNERNAARIKEKHDAIVTLIDSLPSASYVINPETYELLMVNETTKSTVPNVKNGDKCHIVFRGFNDICEDCPVAECMRTGKVVKTDIYNTSLDMWFETTASKLKWHTGINACLINCFDITKYKKREALSLGGEQS